MSLQICSPPATKTNIQPKTCDGGTGKKEINDVKDIPNLAMEKVQKMMSAGAGENAAMLLLSMGASPALIMSITGVNPADLGKQTDPAKIDGDTPSAVNF